MSGTDVGPYGYSWSPSGDPVHQWQNTVRENAGGREFNDPPGTLMRASDPTGSVTYGAQSGTRQAHDRYEPAVTWPGRQCEGELEYLSWIDRLNPPKPVKRFIKCPCCDGYGFCRNPNTVNTGLPPYDKCAVCNG